MCTIPYAHEPPDRLIRGLVRAIGAPGQASTTAPCPLSNTSPNQRRTPIWRESHLAEHRRDDGEVTRRDLEEHLSVGRDPFFTRLVGAHHQFRGLVVDQVLKLLVKRVDLRCVLIGPLPVPLTPRTIVTLHLGQFVSRRMIV